MARIIWKEDEVKRLLGLKGEGLSILEIARAMTEEFEREFSSDAIVSKLNRVRKNADSGVLSFQDLVQVEKEEALSRRRDRARKKEVQEQARWEILCDTIKDAITPLNFKPAKIKVPKSKTMQAEEAVLLISDVHIGKKTSVYNTDVAAERFEELIDSVIDIITIHRHSYPVNTLNIFWVGDIVDGEGIYPNQAHHLDAHIVDQIFTPAPRIVAQLVRLADFFDHVKNTCVRGNHGRVSRYAHEDANYDRIFYKVMEIATAKAPNIKWNILEGWHALTTVLNTRFLLVHGHQIKMTLNLPWYGITTRISRWAATEGISDFDIACMGHFHVGSIIGWSQKRIITNGTFVDKDDFALEFIGLESSQSQWLFGVHPKRGKTWDYEIKFN